MSLFDGDKEISEYFTMSAKDMCQLQNTKKLIKANVASFKIEGRMKSEHYIATVVNDYRKTIDAYYDGVNPGKQYINDVAAAANRETSIAWFDGKPGIQQMLYHEEAKKVTQNFVFSITSKVNANTYVILSRNNFKLTDKFEILSQKQKDIVNIGVSKIVDKDGNEIEVAKTPMSVLTVTFEKDIDLLPNDIVRIKAK
jgi:putative protease